MNRPYRILFILEYYHPHLGGVETLFKNLIEQLTHQGHQVTVLTNRYSKELPTIETGHNLTIKRYRFFNRYLFTFFAWIPALTLAGKCDFIHTTSYNAAIPAWIAGKFKGKRVFITFHEVWGELWYQLPWMSGLSKFLHQSFEALLLKLPFYRYIAVSHFTANRLEQAGIPKDKIVTIYNGIDYEKFSPRPEPKIANVPFRFLYFGRIGVSKGLDILLKAAQILKDQSIAFQLELIVPKEALLDKIEGIITDYQLESHIVMEHELSYAELTKHIQQADTVVIPSYSEGFCFAAAESIALGTPLISSGRGALPEVVSGQYIHLPTLSAEELAHAMKEAMADHWTQTPIKKFHLSQTVQEYIDLYKNSDMVA